MGASKKYGKIILIILMSLTIWLSPSLAMADDHEKGHNDSKQREIRKEHDGEHDDKREGSKDDEGDGVTGQIALWLLVAANLTVVFSIDSCAGCRAPGCRLKGIYGEKCNYHFGNRVPIVRVCRTCGLSFDLVH